jgi:hypothetical protein
MPLLGGVILGMGPPWPLSAKAAVVTDMLGKFRLVIVCGRPKLGTRLLVARPRCYGSLAGSICGVRTGLAIPKKITTPCPPQRVESASSTPGKQLSMF